MIFPAEQCRQILEGRKTQTRRPANGRQATRRHPAAVAAPTLDMAPTQQLRSTTHRVGRVYPLERPAARSEMSTEEISAAETTGRRPAITIGYVECTALRLERLGAISQRDLRAEGCRTTVEFAILWLARRDHRWLAGWRADEDRDDEVLLGRYRTVCAEQLVWVLTIEVIEAPRLLAARTSRGDYTADPRRAMRGEPEAISAATQDTYSRIAHEQDRSVDAFSASETVKRLRVELAKLRASDVAGIANHREVAREISRIERSLNTLTQKLSGRVLQ